MLPNKITDYTKSSRPRASAQVPVSRSNSIQYASTSFPLNYCDGFNRKYPAKKFCDEKRCPCQFSTSSQPKYAPSFFYFVIHGFWVAFKSPDKVLI